MIKLYDTEVSGNVYKVRLMLSLLGLKYERVPIDLKAGQQKSADYIAKNARGQVPFLEDGAFAVRDSSAILLYLALKYGKGKWYPKDPEGQAEVQQWLATASCDINEGLARARAIALFNRPGDKAAATKLAYDTLALMQTRLKQREWLATGEPTIADIACYPYTALSPQGGISLANAPAVVAWMRRIEKLPGYVGMPGVPAVV
jgi:glutathione S-transferase